MQIGLVRPLTPDFLQEIALETQSPENFCFPPGK